MNIHLMLILLAFKQPQPTKDLPLLEWQQISAPLSLHEDQTSLEQLHKERLAKEKLLKELTCRI